MATVRIANLTKSYAGGGVKALSDLNIDIADGEFLVLVGPSGCGKSTALKMIAGLEDITSGEVLIGGEVVNDRASRDRDIAMVFQSYALYPHMSVFDNIAFSLQLARIPKPEIRERVAEVARILQLEPYLSRKPGNLSGGQRQRVAMGRAIIRQPAVFLMDEPLSNLDAKLRVQMRSEVAQIQRRLNVTTIYVTHDQVEAMTMGHRVALMREGVLQQVDTPDNIYNKPANTFVAAFIGSPSMNLVHARVEEAAGRLRLAVGDDTLPVTDMALQRYPAVRGLAGQPVILGIRPEDMNDTALTPGHPEDQLLKAEVALVESLGSDHMAHLRVNARSAAVQDADDEAVDRIDFEASAAHPDAAMAIGRFGARSAAKAGDVMKVAVSCDWLHFFDPATGNALSGEAA